jgi:hypothetical protein
LSTDTTTPAPADQDAETLYTELRAATLDLFEDLVSSVCLNRSGGFDGAFGYDHNYNLTPVRPRAAVGSAELDTFAARVRAYIEHDDADSFVITRANAAHPLCVDLYLG